MANCLITFMSGCQTDFDSTIFFHHKTRVRFFNCQRLAILRRSYTFPLKCAKPNVPAVSMRRIDATSLQVETAAMRTRTLRIVKSPTAASQLNLRVTVARTARTWQAGQSPPLPLQPQGQRVRRVSRVRDGRVRRSVSLGLARPRRVVVGGFAKPIEHSPQVFDACL